MLTYDKIHDKYGKTHWIRKVSPPNWDGTVEIYKLRKSQSVCAGGNDYYWLLTEKSDKIFTIYRFMVILFETCFTKPKFVEDDKKIDKNAKKQVDKLLQEAGINKK